MSEPVSTNAEMCATSELVDELEEMADRITRYSNNAGDGTLYAAAKMLREQADRIDALEECLREFLVAWDMRDDLEHELALTEAIDKARALLEEK